MKVGVGQHGPELLRRRDDVTDIDGLLLSHQAPPRDKRILPTDPPQPQPQPDKISRNTNRNSQQLRNGCEKFDSNIEFFKTIVDRFQALVGFRPVIDKRFAAN